MTGLIRSLLHDILRACPDLIRDTLPDYWTQLESTPWQAQRKLPLSDKSIRAAFSRLISDKNLYRNHCFCFFIDGLDEYDGTHQEDAKTLVDLLYSWVKLAPETVKICVSSREDNVFINAFLPDQRIRLHDLTRSDITSYVLDKLRHMDYEEHKSTLTEAIVENAQVIFVWVTLVVKRVREQIENGINIDILEREIYALPKLLSGLFEYILNSLVDTDLKAAYQTFSMVFKLNEYKSDSPLRLTLLSYSFLDDYAQDPKFALEDFKRRSLDPEETALRIESARKRLNVCCRGLLEVRWNGKDDTIAITHRSIPEFLSSRPQKDRMEQHLNGFNTVDAISQLTLAELWSRNAGNIIQRSNFDMVALSLVPLRIKTKLDEPPYTFLLSLASVWQRHQCEGNFDRHGDLLTIFGEDKAGLNLFFWVVSVPPRPQRERVQDSRVLRELICSAALHGNYDFVKWELEHDTAAIPLFTPLRLLHCLLSKPGCTTPQGLRDMVDCLHTHGIRPNIASNLFLTWLYPVMSDVTFLLGDKNTVVTIWHHILLRCYRCDVWSYVQRLTSLGYIVEKFLEYGADPYFYISVTKSPNWHLKLVVGAGRERQEHWLKYTDPSQGLSECENMSLTDLVERWGFENKTRILELIEKNTLMLEGADKHELTTLPGEEQSVKDPSAALSMVDQAAGVDSKASTTDPISDNMEVTVESGSTLKSLAGVEGLGLLSIDTAISICILLLGECHSSVIQASSLNIVQVLRLLYLCIGGSIDRLLLNGC